jgi:hypothetical protein
MRGERLEGGARDVVAIGNVKIQIDSIETT